MMVGLGLVVGLLTVRLLVMCARDLLDAPVLQRHNVRNRVLPTAAGLLVVLAVLVVESGRATLGAFGLGDEPGRNLARPLVLFACLGFGLLNALDAGAIVAHDVKAFPPGMGMRPHDRMGDRRVAVYFRLCRRKGPLAAGKVENRPPPLDPLPQQPGQGIPCRGRAGEFRVA